jgi:DNA uptake protein ComE-like DNA-binding protein
MKLPRSSKSTRGSTFVIVLWIAFGLVSIALYFGSSMSLELRASDNRTSAVAADLAIEGAARYVSFLLASQITVGSNGVPPDPTSYASEAVLVGDSHFWLIGRETNNSTAPTQLSFGLVDEASKINLNSASSNTLVALLENLPLANQDIVGAITDWRDTNGGGSYQTYYATRPQPYLPKSAPFETMDELRLLYGADMQTLLGEDMNRNGILDPNETDTDRDGIADPGLLEYATVYSCEPNTRTNGEARINIRTVTGANGPLQTFLQSTFGSTRANIILQNIGVLTTGPVGPGRGPPGGTITVTFASPLAFYRASRMTSDEFGKIANDITVTNGSFITGRINVNTASATVLSCLPGIRSNPELGQTLVSYREANPDKLSSIGWIADALGQSNSSTLNSLQASDSITTRSYQYTADVAALGPNNRGYHRVRFVFDTSSGVPKIIYRQDLTHLGWALGKDVRQTWLLANVKK